jgi:putative sterol carrier protein
MAELVKPTKDQIVQFYRAALDRCVEGFSMLDDKEWNKKASDDFTARQHLALLAFTHEAEGQVLAKQALAGEPGKIEGFDDRAGMAAFRKANAMKGDGLSTQELLDKFREGNEDSIRQLEGLSEADLDKPIKSPAWDRPGTLRDVYFASYLFLPAQYQEIRKVNKKKLPHWIEQSTPEQVNYHMGRLFNYMPLIFRSDRAEDMKATYLFTMEGAGGGQWALSIAEGRADSQDGAPESHDVEIKTKPELWIDLSTGDLNPVWAITTRKVQIGGQAALALKLSNLFSAEE